MASINRKFTRHTFARQDNRHIVRHFGIELASNAVDIIRGGGGELLEADHFNLLAPVPVQLLQSFIVNVVKAQDAFCIPLSRRRIKIILCKGNSEPRGEFAVDVCGWEKAQWIFAPTRP